MEREFDVVATVGDGNALVAAAETLAPDVIVTDIAMPGLNGITAAAEILRSNPAARIVFVTVYNRSSAGEERLGHRCLGLRIKAQGGR